MDFINQDEVEHFGFLGVAFTAELGEEMQECLNELFLNTHAHQKIQAHITEAFKKNFFIFNNFVLRNILKFPGNFKLERKVTDKTIEVDLAGLVERLGEKQLRILELKRRMLEVEEKIAVEEDRKGGYDSLLRNKAGFMDMCTGAREIKQFLRETNDLFEKYKTGAKRKDNEFEKLMEYKNIKSEYYKNERDGLLRVADYETLEYLGRCM